MSTTTAATKPTVLVTETLDTVCANWLAQRTNLAWCSHEKTDELNKLLPTAQGLVIRTYTRIDDALLDRAPQLKVIGRAGVGLDNVDLPACKRRNVPVVFTPDANTQAVVEYVLGLVLDVLRPRDPMPGPVSDKEFHHLRKVQVGKQLDELTLGILGFGRIGKKLGRVAHALGIKLLVNDILPESELRAAVEYPVEFVDKPTLYQNSDIISVHVDGRPQNKKLIDARAMAMLKPSCLFINAARGMLVDNDALATWARTNEQHGGILILDVHEPEPMPLDYPLYNIPNVRLLPHLASRTHRALENMSWVVRDVDAALRGEKPQYPAW